MKYISVTRRCYRVNKSFTFLFSFAFILEIMAFNMSYTCFSGVFYDIRTYFTFIYVFFSNCYCFYCFKVYMIDIFYRWLAYHFFIIGDLGNYIMIFFFMIN